MCAKWNPKGVSRRCESFSRAPMATWQLASFATPWNIELEHNFNLLELLKLESLVQLPSIRHWTKHADKKRNNSKHLYKCNWDIKCIKIRLSLQHFSLTWMCHLYNKSTLYTYHILNIYIHILSSRISNINKYSGTVAAQPPRRVALAHVAGSHLDDHQVPTNATEAPVPRIDIINHHKQQSHSSLITTSAMVTHI